MPTSAMFKKRTETKVTGTMATKKPSLHKNCQFLLIRICSSLRSAERFHVLYISHSITLRIRYALLFLTWPKMSLSLPLS